MVQRYNNTTYFSWQMKLPHDIKVAFITDNNPHGTITMNELELDGAVLGIFYSIPKIPTSVSITSWVYELRNSKSTVAGYLL